jgi:hypothetical protein
LLLHQAQEIKRCYEAAIEKSILKKPKDKTSG